MSHYGVAGPTRRYALIVTMLVGLASAPTLAAIAIGTLTVKSGDADHPTTPLLGQRGRGSIVIDPPPVDAGPAAPVPAPPTGPLPVGPAAPALDLAAGIGWRALAARPAGAGHGVRPAGRPEDLPVGPGVPEGTPLPSPVPDDTHPGRPHPGDGERDGSGNDSGDSGGDHRDRRDHGRDEEAGDGAARDGSDAGAPGSGDAGAGSSDRGTGSPDGGTGSAGGAGGSAGGSGSADCSAGPDHHPVPESWHPHGDQVPGPSSAPAASAPAADRAGGDSAGAVPAS